MRYNRLYKDNGFLTPTAYTQELSEYLSNLSYEDIPADVIERAKMILMHTVGVSLAARDCAATAKARQMAREANAGAGGGVTVWGTGEKSAALNAALVLGTMADALNWEAYSWTGAPSAGVIPCAWLAAEERRKSGKELLTAIVGAYEVYQRIAMAVQPSDDRWRAKGWGLTSWQVFACLLAGAKAYGLDARKINQAIGLGCECSTMPTAYHDVTLSDFVHFEYGYRARDGFLIAKAAEKGIHNNRDTLDEPRLYTGVICGDSAKDGNGETVNRAGDADVSWLTRELGTWYLIKETLLKRWPADLWAQPILEIVCSLQKEHAFAPDEVEAVIVDPPMEERMPVPENGFTCPANAQRSIPFVIAALLHDPQPGAKWFSQETMSDPKVIALARRVTGGASPAVSRLDSLKQFRAGTCPAQTVTVRLKDGRELKGKLDCPPGHPDNMLSWEALTDLFRVQAAPVLQGGRLEEAVKVLSNIEQCEDISALSTLLC